MFCPSCKDEFRAGFTRCANCDVDLVEDLSKVERTPVPAERQRAEQLFVPMREYCGFLDLEEARRARDTLRLEGIRCEIAIRDAPGSDPREVIEEEYWLRIEAAKIASAQALLGFDESSGADVESETETCETCGGNVAREESFCPRCGARFSRE
jgi:hypothetical protein